ncbi:MAG: MurR/RpiR family transcriptional regulator [Eubacterium sp.]|nr:MurR/RpiR family transcriptional regulator [Eubacterium sp.]
MKNEKKGLFSLMSRIDGMSNQFTKTDWKIVQFMKNSPQEFLAGSAQNLAAKINISDASIVRFAQKVGFSGLSELKYTLQNELDKESAIISHNAYTSLMQDYSILTEALFKMVKPDHIDILRKQMLKAKRIYIVGLDQNRNVAELAINKFTLLGMDVQAITTRDALKFRASLATHEELFIIITFSGNRHSLAEALGEIIQNDSFIALISNYEKSICSAYADIVFLIPKTSSLENNDTITREIFILMLFDVIFLNFLNEDAKSREMFQKIAPFAEKSRMEDE